MLFRSNLLQYIISQDESFFSYEKIMWVMQRKEDNAFIGMRILYHDGNDTYEIQGDTKKEFWRQGYTKEAYQGILDFIEESYAASSASIYSRIQIENENAIALVNSIGFSFDQIIHENGVPLLRFVKKIN